MRWGSTLKHVNVENAEPFLLGGEGKRNNAACSAPAHLPRLVFASGAMLSLSGVSTPCTSNAFPSRAAHHMRVACLWFFVFSYMYEKVIFSYMYEKVMTLKSRVYLLKDRDPVGLSASRSVGFSKWTVLILMIGIGRTLFDTTLETISVIRL